ncbi:MAG TPA: DUF378 domain-containing protein [Cerasibacillus sp.]|uniref:DUF378 domain-containing protein n=1 Tax=Cerasibacillus sp. TaxID=2498711 RepID=UPI002F4016BF
MKTLQRIALILTIIGAINWGLIGFFDFDLVAAIFGGQDAAFSRTIYSLVGLSGLFAITLLFDQTDDIHHEEMQRGPNQDVRYGTEFAEDQDLTSNDLEDK